MWKKIAKVHGENHPELLEIRDEFFNTADALTTHMKKEEFILFPYIKAMEQQGKIIFPCHRHILEVSKTPSP